MSPSVTGVAFENTLPENPIRNGFTYEYYYNGGGVAAGDLNGNGFPDLYFTANMGPNRLYVNHGGLRFEEVTDRAGVAGLPGGWSTGVTFIDINQNGRLDIYVSQSGPFTDPDLRRNVLYVNQGPDDDGVPIFTEEAAAYGLDDPAYSTQAAFLDCDGDGYLDMYLMNAGVPAYRTFEQLQTERSPFEIDKLYRNEGGSFTDITHTAGLIDTNLGFGLGVSVGDLNNDGRPDIYVANDYSGRDYLYLGRPGCVFEEVLYESMAHTPLAAMGSDIADIDGDGWLDLVVLEMAMDNHYDRNAAAFGFEAERFADLVAKGQHYQYMANSLQWNRGVPDGDIPVFSDIAYLTGVARTDWSWAALLADLNNSGRPDLFVTNGIGGGAMSPDFEDHMAKRVAEVQASEGRITHSLLEELLERLPRRKVPNRIYQNEGDLRFSDRTLDWGFANSTYSHGAVYVDLDRDGDLDLVVNNLFGTASIYRNNARETNASHFLAVQFDGPAENRFGIGTRVRLKAGGKQQVQELYLTRGYKSSVEPILHFGLGAEAIIDTLEVTWSDGRREVLTQVEADRYIAVRHEHASIPEEPAMTQASTHIFLNADELVTPLPRHHASISVTDTELHPYPSRRDDIALAVGDLSGNGLDDFFFGGGGSEPSRIYLQEDDGDLVSVSAFPAGDFNESAVAAAIFDADGSGWNDIWIVLQDMERHGHGVPTYRHRLLLNSGEGWFRQAPDPVPGLVQAGAVLAAGDFDGDGRVDLFVGSHAVPGTGAAPGSRLLRNEGGTFRDVTSEIAPELDGLHTVTDAVWADLAGDGRPDLIVVGEWMPVTLLRNNDGRLLDSTLEAGLHETTGWWQSVAVGDFNGNQRPDIVAGNLGLNYPYLPASDKPFSLFVHDFSGDGREEALPAYFEDGSIYPWFDRERMAQNIPEVSTRYPTYDEYARASLADIVGSRNLGSARRYDISTLASLYLENLDGQQFLPHELPRSAQVSAVTGIAAADFTGDGQLDLILAGNFEELDPSVPKLDAGVGLFLRGDGAGTFEAVMPDESRLFLRGRVRGLDLITIGPDRVPGLIAGVVGSELLHVRWSPLPDLDHRR